MSRRTGLLSATGSGARGEYEDGQPCEEEGSVCDDFAEAQRWAYRHLKVHQDHRSYEHVAVTPWLMVPAEEPS
ncbi:hypothetical protein [Kitasatospora sp. NPDC087315]|uniref:DUF7848 domain-containing protein n=1 Tax=Kitasatospora sp. NPDC087315 TaxID=3364069 RepID=UPI00382888DC